MAIHGHSTSEIKHSLREQFYKDVVEGLCAPSKFLHSKYLYNLEGDKLFQKIMDCPEYYLTKCEHEIFSTQTKNLADSICRRYTDFDILELGAGDAKKSFVLLSYLINSGLRFTYYPIDISQNIILQLETELPYNIPMLDVNGLNGEYIEMINIANERSQKRKLILFLGASIGNYSPEEAKHFLKSLHESMAPGDLLLIGFDLKKNPKQILDAYNDKEGITRDFNLNLLDRINVELGANFNRNAFVHYPTYNPTTGACESYLVSLSEQQVKIEDWTIEFSQYETIHMERSQKYSVEEIDILGKQAGFDPLDSFWDKNRWFVNVLWEKREG